MKRAATGFGIALIVLILDQLTKSAVLAHVADRMIAVLPVFNLALVWNHGVSFGMFNHGQALSPLLFVAVSGVIAAGFTLWLLRVQSLYMALSLGLVIGGAMGNVIDRLRLGAVVDFLDFHIGDWHYPAFNVADSAVVVGIALILFDGLWLNPRKTGPVS